MTKHVSQFSVLMFGRVTGGISTSLLFNVFESWLVCEHNARGYSPDLLSGTFGLAIFGNSIMAIIAGTLAQFAADFKPLTPPMSSGATLHYGGYCSPFDVSILFLLLCFGALQYLWGENYAAGRGGHGPPAAGHGACAAQGVGGVHPQARCAVPHLRHGWRDELPEGGQLGVREVPLPVG